MSGPAVCPICETPTRPWDRDPEILCCDFHAWGTCPRCGREGVPVSPEGSTTGRWLCGPCIAVQYYYPVPWVALVAEDIADLEAVRVENEACRRSGGRLP